MSAEVYYGYGNVTALGSTAGSFLAFPYARIESLPFDLATEPGQYTVERPFTARFGLSVHPCDYAACDFAGGLVYMLDLVGTATGSYAIVADGENPDFVHVEYQQRVAYVMSRGTWFVEGDAAQAASPEPGSMVLAGLGLAVVYWVRRRKNVGVGPAVANDPVICPRGESVEIQAHVPGCV